MFWRAEPAKRQSNLWLNQRHKLPDKPRVSLLAGLRSKRVAIRHKLVAVLCHRYEVQWNVLLRIHRRYFETHNLEVSLARYPRLLRLFPGHSRVIHCDFIER